MKKKRSQDRAIHNNKQSQHDATLQQVLLRATHAAHNLKNLELKMKMKMKMQLYHYHRKNPSRIVWIEDVLKKMVI